LLDRRLGLCLGLPGFRLWFPASKQKAKCREHPARDAFALGYGQLAEPSAADSSAIDD
jgi:hypothetical protein